MSQPKKVDEVFVTWGIVLLCLSIYSDQLEVGFYKNSCGSAEFIIKDVVRDAFIKDNGIAPGLVRMHFHDCFVRGCDGSILIDSTSSTKAEKDSPINNPSLRGFEVIDTAKAKLESACIGVVSCADILAFAARDCIEITGGFGYDVPAGRRDGRVSLASETGSNIPGPTFSLNQLTQNFANKGLSQEEMVTLSGGHTIGRSHCTSFTNRLYNFSSTNNQDPALDASYATKLKQQCPPSSGPGLVVLMDPGSPSSFDSGYYCNVLANEGLFTSDQSLLASPSTASQVKQNVDNQFQWKRKFADAMVKMGQIGAGNAGEIRSNCRIING